MKKISGIISIILCFAMIVSVITPATKSKAAGDDMIKITIDGRDVDYAAGNVNGLPYKGFGVLSANSTSNLLIDYKYESPAAYNELLEVFFGGEHPLMNHVKIEMGNDGNNSTGADSCTMRFEGEEADASRSPGFILAADAKKVNPDVKVSILRWEMPAWVQNYWNTDRTGKGFEAMYTWYKETIFDAYEKYGYILDYVNPDKNETGDPDEEFIVWIADRIETEDEFPEYMDQAAIDAYHNMKIIASDEYLSLNIVPSMRKDPAVYNAVDAIGLHYTTGTAQSTPDYVRMADEDDKEVWYSEGCACFSYSDYHKNKTTAYGAGTIGGYQSPLAMCDCMVKSATYSRRSHFIFQPAIGSFYEGSQYDHKELVSAREPWSGHIHYDQSIYCLSHFTRFAKTGWENKDNTNGIWRIIPEATYNNSDGTEHLRNENGQPSYMTLASPDCKNFSTIIVNNSAKELSYEIELGYMDIPEGKNLEIWQSKTDSYMKYTGNAEYSNGTYKVEVEPYSIITVTSLECNGKEEYTKRLPNETYNFVLDTDANGNVQDTASNILYADDYQYDEYSADYLKARGNEPRYTVDYSGAYAVEDGKLKHLLDTNISQWQNNTPNAVIGDYRWMNYLAEIDVEVPGNSSAYAGLVIREQTGLQYQGSGYNLQIKNNGSWTLNKGYDYIASGNVAEADTYRLGIEGRGSKITAFINGEKVHEYTDTNPQLFGRVRIFNGWHETYFDNLVVKKLTEDGDVTTIDADLIPYGEPIIDNADSRVKYEGNWDVATTGAASDWYRSTSTSSSAGASFTFDINSDGFSLIGKNDNEATIDVEIDGSIYESDVKTQKSPSHGSAYIVSGLGNSKHTVKVTLKAGTFVLDAIMPFGNRPVNVTAVTLPESQIIIAPNATKQLAATVAPANATCSEIKYMSEDSSIVKVDSATGLIKAVNNGKTKVYAYSCDGSKKYAVVDVTVAVPVNNQPVVTPTQQPPAVTTPAPQVETAKKLAAPKIVSIKCKGKKTTIKWKKVKNADGYIIKRSTKKNKGFKKIATIKKKKTTKYVDKKGGKKYYYKICAYSKDKKKKVEGKYSKAVKASKK